MTTFRFPQPGERHNAAAVLVTEPLLRDLVLSVVNGYANSICLGCAACQRSYAAAAEAFTLLSLDAQAEVRDYAHDVGVDIASAWGVE